MFDAIVTKNFEVAPTHIDIFGAITRWSSEHGWEHNLNGWMRRGASRVFQSYGFYDFETLLEDCVVSAAEAGIISAVEMIVISPPTAVGLFVENILTGRDFETAVYKKPCFFDIPDIRFGDIETPMTLRVAQNPGSFFCCGVADAHGKLL